MNYLPPDPLRLWDCWILPWEGEYHLIHLQYTLAELADGSFANRWAGLGHAVSRDLVHWQRRATIEIEEVAASWESRIGLTGTLLRHDGQFWMFYGAADGGVQRLGGLVSDDLVTWHKHPANPLVGSAPPYHNEHDPRTPPYRNVWWRDPHISWREDLGCYEMLVGARLPYRGQGKSGTCIARARSRDLVHWSHLEPLVDVGDRLLVADVPDRFAIDGTWYLTFNSASTWGRRIASPSRPKPSGSFYMIGPTPDGPFEFPDDPCLLGAGNGRHGPTVLFTLDDAGGAPHRRLALHHHGWPDPHLSRASFRPSLALPKYLVQNGDRSLSLAFHPNVAALEARVLAETLDVAGADTRYRTTGEWENRGTGTHGLSQHVSSVLLAPQRAADVHVTCRLRFAGAERAGIVLRLPAEPRPVGLAVTVDRQAGEVSFGPARPEGQFGALNLDTCHSCRWDVGDTLRLRVLARDRAAEVYLDDRLALCVSLQEQPRAGAAGCFVEGGACTFEQFRVAELEPLRPLPVTPPA